MRRLPHRSWLVGRDVNKMRHMRAHLLLAFAAVLAGGCGPDLGGNLTFRDARGRVVAVADLKPPERLPPPGRSFEGWWHLRSHTSDFPSAVTNDGRYVGSVGGRIVSISLSPGFGDAGVWLGGEAAEPWDGSLSGEWGRQGFAGGTQLGTFTLAAPRR